MVRRSFVLLLISLCASVLHAQRSYFEDPVPFAEASLYSNAVETAAGALVFYQRVIDVEGVADVTLIVRESSDGLAWGDERVVTSGIGVETDVIPPIYSVASDGASGVLVTILDYDRDLAVPSTRFLLSEDGGATFEQVLELTDRVDFLSPRAFSSASGGWFVTFELFGLTPRTVYLSSPDGRSWSDPLLIPVNWGEVGAYREVTHAAKNGRDLFFVVGGPFRSGIEEVSEETQIYSLYTDDLGATWAAVDPVSGDTSARVSGVAILPVDQLGSTPVVDYQYLRPSIAVPADLGLLFYQDFVMRRPSASPDGSFIAFEGAIAFESDGTRQILAVDVDQAGNFIGTPQSLTSNSLSARDTRVPYNEPIAIALDGTRFVAAYESPDFGGAIALYERSGSGWTDVSPSGLQSTGLSPTGVSVGNRPHFFWHGRSSGGGPASELVTYLEPDQRALPPLVQGTNFRLGRRSGADVAAFAWGPDTDASGIVGYAFEWTRDAAGQVPVPDVPSIQTAAEFPADDDGEWYLRIRAVDRAGNWSMPGTFEFFRDTTPPGRVVFAPPVLDEDGFLASNTFTLAWDPPADDVVETYFSDLIFLGSATTEVDPLDPPSITPINIEATTADTISRNNYDNGLWALAVTPIDSVGNVGDPSFLLVRMNKYIPVTIINTVLAVPDALGRYAMSIIGRGFTANGVVNQVILDRDGSAPFDYVFDRSDPGYRIFDDRNMSGPLLDDIETGEYLVGLLHSERGLEFAGLPLAVERNGTVKFGAYTVLPGAEFQAQTQRRRLFDGTTATAWIVLVLMAAVAIVSATRLAVVANENVQLRVQARALITGDRALLPGTQKRLTDMRNRGIGLRLKFASFVVVLIVAVVAGVSFFLGSRTLSTQQGVLLTGLTDRIDVLLESIVSRAQVPLLQPEDDVLDLEVLPESSSAMDEALYVTVTGPRSANAPAPTPDEPRGMPESPNFIWGSNDPVVLAVGEIDAEALSDLNASRAAQGLERSMQTAADFDDRITDNLGLVLGQSIMSDSVSDEIELIEQIVERLAAEQLNEEVRQRELNFWRRDELRREIALSDGDTTALEQEQANAERNQRSLNIGIRATLDEIVLQAIAIVRADRLARLATDATDVQYTVPDSNAELRADIDEAIATVAASDVGIDTTSAVIGFPFFESADFGAIQSDYIFYQIVSEPGLPDAFPISSTEIENLDDADLAGLSYFRGAVRLGIATDIIADQIAIAQTELILLTLLIAGIAIVGGVIGAILLARLVVVPIERVVLGVEKIRDTKDKRYLGRDIEVRSRDELRRLADSVNDMAEGLATAAVADQQLRATSALQKQFLPLRYEVRDLKEHKLTTTEVKDLGAAEAFGYYEGADALSGDYFTVDQIDANHWAFIKCDVSGHGVDAAFIMAIVATMFDNRFEEWKSRQKRTDIVSLLQDINRIVEGRSEDDKFAAMTIGVIDTSSGSLRLAHGGDQEQRIFRDATKSVEEINLGEVPATGMFDNDMVGHLFVESGNYRLKYGDVIMLMTDGIEESGRKLRDPRFDTEARTYPILKFEPEAADEVVVEAEEFGVQFKKDDVDGKRMELWDPVEGDLTLEFSTKRVCDIVECAMTQGSYVLKRFRTLHPDEHLEFDFGGLSPTAETLVMSVMAVEQIFRLTRAPEGASVEAVKIDSLLVDFMKDRFSEFWKYFGNELLEKDRPDASVKNEGQEDESLTLREPEYRFFDGLLQEVQADDLTILAIRKK